MNKTMLDAHYFLHFLATIDKEKFYFMVEKNAITQVIDIIQNLIAEVKNNNLSEKDLSIAVDKYITIFNIRCKQVEDSPIMRFNEKQQAAFDEFKTIFTQFKSDIVYLSFNPKKK